MTIKRDEYGNQVQAARPFTAQSIVFSATNRVSTPFGAGPTSTYDPAGNPVRVPNNTQHIRVVSTSNCWIAFGGNVRATPPGSATPLAVVGGTTSIYLPAGVPEYFWVYPGEVIAVVQDSVGGTLNIAELTQ